MLVNNRIQQPRQLVQCELFNKTERMASNKLPCGKAQLQKNTFFIKVHLPFHRQNMKGDLVVHEGRILNNSKQKHMLLNESHV